MFIFSLNFFSVADFVEFQHFYEKPGYASESKDFVWFSKIL